MSDAISPPPHIDDRVFGRWVVGIWSPFGVGAKLAVTLAVVFSWAIFSAGSHWLALPALQGFDGGLFFQPSPAAAFCEVAVLLLVSTLVGTVLAGAVRFEAGLFSAAAGLAAISIRCGTMQSVLLEAGGKEAVYGRLFIELLILWALAVGLWLLLQGLGKINAMNAAHSGAIDAADDESSLSSGLSAAMAQIVSTAVIVLFLCQSEAKNQAIASVAIASILGTMIAYKFSPARPSIWYWSGPILVGLIGYALAYLGKDSPLGTGNPTGTFAPLARPLPIDYASAGITGAILGYWMLRHKRPSTTP